MLAGGWQGGLTIFNNPIESFPGVAHEVVMVAQMFPTAESFMSKPPAWQLQAENILF